MKKLLSVLLAVMMLMSALPVMAEEVTWDVVQGEHYANYEDATENHKDVTCTENGWVEYVCQDPDCTVETFRVEILAQGHKHADDAEAVIITPATCEGEGVREWQECLNCHQAYTETIAPIGHSWEVKVDEEGNPVVVEPWCTTEGYTVYECVRPGCDAEKNDDHVPALGHDWALAPQYEGMDIEYSAENIEYFTWTEVDSATCVDGGKLVKFTYCARCFHKDVIFEDSNYWPVVDHQAFLNDFITPEVEMTAEEYAEWILMKVAAADGDYDNIITCDGHEVESTEDGYRYFHHPVEVIKVNPTCEGTGTLTLACTECEAKVEVTLPATGHAFSYNNEKEDNIPTCLEDGKILVVCLNGCGYEEQINVAAPGHHTWDAENSTYSQVKFFETIDHGTFDQIATCIDYTEHQPCKGFTLTVELKNGYTATFTFDACDAEFDVAHTGTGEHDKSTENYAFRDSTCTEEGYEYFYCNACGYTYGMTIEKKDHDTFSKVIVKPTCTTDGLIHWICRTCDQVIEEQVVPMTGHRYDITEHKDETCTTDGYDLYTCYYCGDNFKETIAAHHVAPNPEDINPELNNNQAYKAPTCTETGLQSYECLVCHQPIVNEVIPALGHEWDRHVYITEYEKDGVYYETYIPATCEHVAEWSRKCDHCGKVETVKGTELKKHMMAGFNVNGDQVVNSLVLDTSKLPTCTETGIAYYNCVVCGKLVEDFVLPTLPHYEITVWNAEDRVYEVSCVKAPMSVWASVMEDYLWNEVVECTENMELAHVVYDVVMDELKAKLSQKDSEFIAGIGCGKTKEIPVNKTHYSIALDGTTVTLTPDENCALLKKPMIIVNWAYTLSDGTAFSYTRLIKAEDLATLTFDLGLAEAPAGSDLESITVIVTDTATLDITVAAKGYGYAQF